MSNEDFARIAVLSEQLGYPVSESEIEDRFESIGSSNGHRLIVAETDGSVIG